MITWPVVDEMFSIVPADLDLYSALNIPKMPLLRASASPTPMRSPSFFNMHSGTSVGDIDSALDRFTGVMSPGMNVWATMSRAFTI